MPKSAIKKLFQLFKKNTPQPVTVVSGLPRSGTSLMMKMLEAGGIAPLTDNQRTPDVDNPKGYYELEIVKKLPDGKTDWLKKAPGKSVKIISALLSHLPDSYTYQVIFMQRNIEEVLASQKKMLIRRGENPDKVSNEELIGLFSDHVKQTKAWIQEHQNHVTCLDVSYNDLLTNNAPIIDQIDAFLDNTLNREAMARVIDPSLYRSKQ